MTDKKNINQYTGLLCFLPSQFRNAGKRNYKDDFEYIRNRKTIITMKTKKYFLKYLVISHIFVMVLYLLFSLQLLYDSQPENPRTITITVIISSVIGLTVSFWLHRRLTADDMKGIFNEIKNLPGGKYKMILLFGFIFGILLVMTDLDYIFVIIAIQVMTIITTDFL